MYYPIDVDFDRDIRDHVLSALPHEPRFRPDLATMQTADLLIIYLNWRYRLISQQPRRIFRSRELRANPLALDPNYRPALKQICELIELGGDLRPHLSRRTKTGYVGPPGGPFGKRSDLDLLLNDWGIHHLHLSSVLEADGFVERTKPVLIGTFERDNAYLIDILPDHHSWTREYIAHILIDNWQQSNFVHEAKGVVGVDRAPSDDERRALRNAGINTGMIGRRGKFYMIGIGGLTSAVTATRNTISANAIMRSLASFRDYLIRNPSYIVDELRARGYNPPLMPKLRLEFLPDDLYVITETTTGAGFELPGLPRRSKASA